MKITGSRVLVLGGWGLVGNAVCKKILSEKPSCLIVTSLNEKEANDAQNQLQTNYPDIEIKSWSEISLEGMNISIPQNQN